jgi:ribonuclease HI
MRIDIYTDGACSGNPGPGGAGYVILADGVIVADSQDKPGYRRTTNNRMEIQAVYDALLELGLLGLFETEETVDLTVYSDSEIVVKTLNGEYARKQNRDLWELVDGALKAIRDSGKVRTLSVVKVKGHSKDVYNAFADKYAVQSRNNPDLRDHAYEESHPVSGEAVPEPEIHEIRFLNHDKPKQRLIEVTLTNGTVTKIRACHGGFEQYDCTRREALVTADLAWRFVGWLNGKKLF